MDHEKASKADQLSQAEHAILTAIQQYRDILAEGPTLDATEITYKPSKVVIDDRAFKIESVNTLSPFRYDGVIAQAADRDIPSLQVLLLALSPHWEDRIRAAALQGHLRNEITMPDGFPCIYVPADSPSNVQISRPSPFVWVASADEAMLHELLPLYRELWGAYEAQWRHTPNRTFVVGRLDKVAPYGVYRPGTTPAEVIGQTMLTHQGMYKTAPAHLRQMHPLHEQWTSSQKTADAR